MYCKYLISHPAFLARLSKVQTTNPLLLRDYCTLDLDLQGRITPPNERKRTNIEDMDIKRGKSKGKYKTKNDNVKKQETQTQKRYERKTLLGS